MGRPIYPEVFVTLATHQVDKLVTFYQSLLDIAPSVFVSAKYAELRLVGVKLAIFQPQTTHFSEFASPTGAAMSLCLEVNNLDTAIAHLVTLGYPPPGQVITASHGREIYAYDPDGNRLILHQSCKD